jgi:putative transposase
MLSIRQQAELLALNRSVIYYKPRSKTLSEGQLGLLRLVDELYTQYPFMGTRQMSDDIASHHYPYQRHQTRWAYEKLGLHASAPGPHTSKPHRDVNIARPCQVFSTDITYIRMQKGFV